MVIDKLNQMKKNVLYGGANILYGHSVNQSLPYDEIKFDKIVILEVILNFSGDSNIGYFVEVDLRYTEDMKENTINFPFAPVNEKINPNDFSYYMKIINPGTFTQTKIILCDWSDKKNYLIHYRMLKFYIGHRMTVKKIHEVKSFKRSKWLQKNIYFNTQKRNQAVSDFEKDFYRFSNNAFYGKTMENVRNRVKLEFIRKDDTDKNIKQQ